MFVQANATNLPFADASFDLVLGSSPYCDARTYGMGVNMTAEEWVEWMIGVTHEACRVSRGLVIWVAASVTRKHLYWPACEGLMWEWFKRGNRLWRPAFWHRDGIPGSGGNRIQCKQCKGQGCEGNPWCSGGLSSNPAGEAPQWLRANIEYAMAFTRCPKRIPWADALANGHPPKSPPGGNPSHRTVNGDRVNGKDSIGFHAHSGCRNRDGTPKTPRYQEPWPNRRANGVMKKTRRCIRGKSGGDTIQETKYIPPDLANPGCLIKGIKVGGGQMGHPLAHKNEAPFPLKLAQWFIRSWCPPGGMVLDPFSGSGTTVHAALSLGRIGVGSDLRLSQCQLGRERCREVQVDLFGAAG
jgi:hypothetical protein